ncbi:glycoside hydrolase family protein [Rhizoctonia solani AG-1 IA]|uniref:Glycoside hydrolase family protein n=1 Tax=Thanatephorus cucumeris (strain AG1-IA) TaxID=983506 RepID=L8X2N8_THACA|nr:glycoside hydrolase family protein [Rhizoctonia solani AG-1 IA]
MNIICRSAIVLFLSSTAIAADGSTGLNASMISQVKQRLEDSAQLRFVWELGTRIQTLLELDTPSFSVFSEDFPSPRNAPNSLDDVIGISRNIVQSKTAGELPLMPDGSAADPASNGVGVLIANWTGASGGNYAQAAADQLTFLLTITPRAPNGAISHRADEAQLWSDFVYMVPPFLAYYGVLTDNQTLVEESYNQIKLYRDVLADDTGMWQHIRLGSFEDRGYWSTGNGWAAMGMLRVLVTIRGSQWSRSMRKHVSDLENWTEEILNAMWPKLYGSIQTNQGMFYNYADDSSTFQDAASAALIAASTYRLSLVSGIHTHLPSAERVHAALSNVGPSTNPNARVTPDGWLTPVVNPHSFGEEGQESAEGQAFVLQMHAAWADWVMDGRQGANSAKRTCGAARWLVVLGVLVGVLGVGA